MSQVRPPAYAGGFYPATAESIHAMIDPWLAQAKVDSLPGSVWGVIVPHAGYIYSGPIAAYGFQALRRGEFETILVLAVNHAARLDFASVYSGTGYQTPLGTCMVDTALAKAIAVEGKSCRLSTVGHDVVGVSRPEHSLEVQLPFLQTVFRPDVRIVPIIVGQMSLAQLQDAAQQIYNAIQGKSIGIVISTDLSHYESYSSAQQSDDRTIREMLSLDAGRFFNAAQADLAKACGEFPVTLGLALAKLCGVTVAKELNRRNSGDTAGDKSQVVGYASIALLKPSAAELARVDPPAVDDELLTKEEQAEIRREVETVLTAVVNGKPNPRPRSANPRLQRIRGVFVTLEKNHQLRGCIGYIEPVKALDLAVAEMTESAALNDPRFNAVQPSELLDISFEVSVLTPPKRIKSPDEMVVGRDGVVIRMNGRSGTFLPQVAPEQHWTRDETWRNVCQKAGLPPDAYRDPKAELYLYQAQVF